MQSMAHELEREGFHICGGIGVSMKNNNDNNTYQSYHLAGSIRFGFQCGENRCT